jgi:nitrogenase subunit NifH
MGGAAIREIDRKVDAFIQSMTQQFNGVVRMANAIREGVASMSGAMTQALQGIRGNMDNQSNALENLDVYNQIFGRMLLRVIERVICLEKPQAQGDEVKQIAEDLFNDLFTETKARVIEERTAYIEKMRAEAREAEEAEQAKKEQGIAEEALLNASKPSLHTQPPDGPPQHPEGADFFGG